MSFHFRWLARKKNESLSDYDKRINSMPAFHAGYAYFGMNAYDDFHHIYALYITWNGEVNSKLFDKLNDFGYVIHCSAGEAENFCNSKTGYLVYVKLRSDNGNLYCDKQYIPYNGKNYLVSYTGMCVPKPDFVYFNELAEDKIELDTSAEVMLLPTSATLNASSFNISSGLFRNIKGSSFNIGSYNVSSFNIGSFNIGSFYAGSFNVSFINNGSFNISFFNTGSYNIGSFNIGSYLSLFFKNGSYNVSSYNIGSFNLGSFNLSSFNLGSYLSGSYKMGSRSFEQLKEVNNDTDSNNEIIDEKMNQYYKDKQIDLIIHEIYGIGCLGYGLNLI